MSMSFRARSGGPPHGPDNADRVFDHWEPDRPYLTDGRNLYRYVGGVPSGTGEIVALEDCQSLKIVLFDLDELRALTLRAVDGPTHESGLRGSR